MKPKKYGIRSYLCADSRTGYCWNLLVYDGTNRPLDETVLLLMDVLLDQFHSLYMDNLYNSVRLFEKLLQRNTYAVGRSLLNNTTVSGQLP